MGGAHYSVVCALLAFLDSGVLSHAIIGPKPYNLWNRDAGRAMSDGGPQTTANSTSLYPDSYFNVSEECVLWDDTCHGDKQNAASVFFGKTLAALLKNECFTVTDSAEDPVVGLNHIVDESPAPYDPDQCPGGISGVPLATSSLWSTLKSWMREPACASSSLEYSSAVHQPTTNDIIYGCCGPCAIGGPNVDVYYWPSPEANTSCLNIIGTSVNPPTQGATTDLGYTYWGYTTTDANILKQIVTTMVYTSINGIHFKMAMSNPWESKPGVTTSSNPGMWDLPATTLHNWSTPKAQRRAESPEATIQARANPIAISNAAHESNWGTVRNDSSLGSIVTYGSHTFTSPSIYVDFYSLSATDACGYRGNTIDSTLLSFAPGELSTVATAMYAALDYATTSGSVYNFDDLPCPPMSVMWSQWYKPEPGEPYRPLIVFPSKLLELDPLWKVCTQGPFTGYDPPRTLNPATAMVPQVTPPSTPHPNPRPATPVATWGNLPKMTTLPDDSTKTTSDPSLARSRGSGSMQEDPSQKTDPPRDKKKTPADASSNNQGKKDPQGQSLQEDPNSSDPKNIPINHASSNDVANSDLDQPMNTVQASGGSSMNDRDAIYQPQPLATSAPAFMTTVLGSQHVLAKVDGHNIDGADVGPGSATDVSGQQNAVASSNQLQVEGQTEYIESALPLVTTAIASQMITHLSKGVGIQGFTPKNGGPVVIVVSTTLSVDGSGNMFINGKSYRIYNDGPVPKTINGEMVMPLQTGISIHSATLTPNAPALVISGTSYSLDISSRLHFGDSTYTSSIMITHVDPTQVTTIAGQPVVELTAGVAIADTTPTAGAVAIQSPTGGLITLDSTNLIVDSAGILGQRISSSGSLSKLITNGLSSQVLGTANGISTHGKNNSSNPSVFTGGSEGRKPDFSMLLSLLVGTWTVIVL